MVGGMEVEWGAARTSFSALRFLCSSSSSLSLFRFLSLLLCFSFAMAAMLSSPSTTGRDLLHMHAKVGSASPALQS